MAQSADVDFSVGGSAAVVRPIFNRLGRVPGRRNSNVVAFPASVASVKSGIPPSVMAFMPGLVHALNALGSERLEESLTFVAGLSEEATLRMALGSIDRAYRFRTNPDRQIDNRLGILEALLGLCRLLDAPAAPAPGIEI